MTNQLFPKPPRQLKQPRKQQLRDELARAATTIELQAAEIERLRMKNEHLRRPWWRRLIPRKAA